MDKTSKTYGRPLVVAQVLDRAERRGREHARASARRRSASRTSSRRPSRRRPGCSTCRPTTSAWTTSRSRSSYTAGPALCRRDAVDVPGPRTATAAWATSSPGTPARARSCGRQAEKFSVWSGALATAGDVVFYGTLEGYLKAVDAKTGQGALQVQDAVRHHRQRVHLRAQGQAVRRRALGHRRLGRHRHGGGPRPNRPPASAPSAATRLSTTTPRSAAS